MAFLKKIWKDRQSEHPLRRKFNAVPGLADTYEVSRDEGLIMETGTALDAATMNDLETRIGNGFESVENTLASDYVKTGDARLSDARRSSNITMSLSGSTLTINYN